QHICRPSDKPRPEVAPGLEPSPERRVQRARVVAALEHLMRMITFLEPTLDDLMAIPPALAGIDQLALRRSRETAYAFRDGQRRDQGLGRDRFRPQLIEAAKFR